MKSSKGMGKPVPTTAPHSPRANPIPRSARSIGQLCIMFAGDSCVGKTQLAHRLIRAIQRASGSKTHCSSSNTDGITEYRASTARVTPWFFNIDRDFASLPAASPEGVPAYNITVLDTYGYGETADPVTTMARTTTYLERAFAHTRKVYASDTPRHDFYRLLAPGSGAHGFVDAVFYLTHAVKPVDVIYMKKLEPFACVVPVSVIDGIVEPLVMDEERAQVRSRYEKLGVTWHEKKGMMFQDREQATQTSPRNGGHEDKRDTMFPFVIHGRVQMDEEEEAQDDFNRMCDLLFRPLKLDRLRYLNVRKFVEWLPQTQEEVVKRQQEEEAIKKQQQEAAMKKQQEMVVEVETVAEVPAAFNRKQGTRAIVRTTFEEFVMSRKQPEEATATELKKQQEEVLAAMTALKKKLQERTPSLMKHQEEEEVGAAVATLKKLQEEAARLQQVAKTKKREESLESL